MTQKEKNVINQVIKDVKDAKRHNMEYIWITQPEEKPCKLYVKNTE